MRTISRIFIDRGHRAFGHRDSKRYSMTTLLQFPGNAKGITLLILLFFIGQLTSAQDLDPSGHDNPATTAPWKWRDAKDHRPGTTPSGWGNYVRDLYIEGDWSRRGYVAIGHVNPTEKLHIKGYNAGSGSTDQRNPTLYLQPYGWVNGRYGKIKFGDEGHFIKSGHTIGMTIKDLDGIGFTTTSNENITMKINNGKVGIGTTSPFARLDVRGTIKVRNENNKVYEIKTDSNGKLHFLRHTNGAESSMTIDHQGHVGIGTTAPGNYTLAVEGKIGARGVDVKLGDWADFVFAEEYALRPLEEVEQFIEQNKHLPEIPTEDEVLEKGLDVGEMLKLQMQKIEELTLYLIDQEKRLKAVEEENTVLRERLSQKTN